MNTKKKSSLSKLWLLLVPVGIGAFGLFVYQAFSRLGGFGPDQIFGDQHLKTTLALVELHKTRTGHYPKALSELRFTGQWDPIALNSVQYCPADDQQSYYLEVTRGWIGKPNLKIRDGFWDGTGFRPELKKACK